MVMQELVSKINAELKALKDEAIRNSETPRLVQVIDILLRLTNGENMEAEPAAEKEGGESEAEQHPPEPCKHPGVSVFGKCLSCGECQHINVDPDTGVCRDCNAEGL